MPNLTWLSPKTEKRDSPVHGRGLFAREAIGKDDVVAVRGGYVMTKARWAEIEPAVGAAAEIHVTADLCLAPSREDECEGAMMHLNHSCDPNVGVEGQIVFVAMRDVARGEELRIDYAMMDDYEAAFECRCGTARCRGTVDGQDWRRPELQERYRGYFSAYLQKRITGGR